MYLEITIKDNKKIITKIILKNMTNILEGKWILNEMVKSKMPHIVTLTIIQKRR